MKKCGILVLVLLFAAGMSGAFADEDYLFVIGGVESSNLYMTFLSLGILGDAYENGVYDDDTAMQIATEIQGLAKNIRVTVNKLIENNLADGDDRVLVLEMIAAQDLLEKQAAELVKYIGNREAPNDFQFYRGQAWEKISKILGIPAQ